jgi:hypothetical protein
MTATASANGPCPKTPHEAASYYFDRGFIPTPCHPCAKIPMLKGWQDLRPTATDLDAYFPPKTTRNIGLVLGEPSNNLVDVDKDCPQAIATAPFLLPETGWVSGRAGAPRSHSWYVVDAAPGQASQKYHDLDNETLLVELRSTGGQTVAPPSVHPSGEQLRWEEFGELGRVEISELDTAVRKVAAASLLARHWPSPGSGSRQDAALGCAGWLLRCGWPVEDVQQFLRAAATAAGDDEIEMRVHTVERTHEKLLANEKVSGLPKLIEAVGKQDGAAVAGRITEWLGLAKRNAEAKKIAPIHPPAPYRPFPVEALPEPIRTQRPPCPYGGTLSRARWLVLRGDLICGHFPRRHGTRCCRAVLTRFSLGGSPQLDHRHVRRRRERFLASWHREQHRRASARNSG